MKLKFLSLILILSSCQTVSRKPALDVSKVDICDFVFDSAFAIVKDENVLPFALTQLAYLNKAYPNEARAQIAKISGQEACIAQTVAHDAELRITQVEAFKKTLSSKKIIFEELDHGQVFADKNFSEKAGCFLECIGKEEQKCEEKCRITRSAVLNTHQLFKLEPLAQGCYLPLNDKTFRREKFQENLAKYLMLYRNYMLRHRAELGTFIDQILASHASLTKLKEEFQSKTSEKEKCPASPDPSWLDSFKGSVISMGEMQPAEGKDSRFRPNGTGFWVEGKDRRARFVTAYHIHNDRELDFSEGDIVLSSGDGEKLSRKKSKFTIEPGFFDRGMDIIQGRGEFSGPFFSVNPTGTLPVANQKFYAVGFPLFLNGELNVMPCRFRGFSKRIQGPSFGTTMQLACEQTTSLLEGMSGGPIVDESGVVWAVITERGNPSGLVFASPIFRANDGDLQMGFQDTQVTSLCLNPKDWSSLQRCQLMPNQFEKQIP